MRDQRHISEISSKLQIIEMERIAKEIIQDAFDLAEYPVIAFSSGKDSQVVLDLVRQINPDVEAVFCNTGNEYTETVPFARSFDNVTELHPEKTFWQCFKEYGMPVVKSKAKRHGNACCFWLKEKPSRDYYKSVGVDLVFTGLTAAESRNRMMMLKRMGHTYFAKTEKLYKCHPIHDWSEDQVWQYIRMKELEYNPIYDLGIPRCGCRFCTAYLSWKEVTALYNEKDTQVLMKKLGNAVLSDYATD